MRNPFSFESKKSPHFSADVSLFAMALFLGAFFVFPVITHAATELNSTALSKDYNLVSYYRLEGNASDTRGSFDGTANGTVSYGTTFGQFGQGTRFYNTNGWITVGPLGITNSTGFSLSVWFESSSTGQNEALVDLGGDSGCDNSIGFVINDDKGGTYSLGLNVGCGPHAYTTSNDFSSSTWHNAVLTLPAGAAIASATIYLDGVSQSLSFVTPGTIPNWRNNTSTFGGASGFASYFGYMDDVAFFNRVLTATEVFNLYNSVPYLGASLNQYYSDASTTITEGGETTESEVVFGDTLNSSGTSNMRLEVEVKPTGTSFTGTANASSATSFSSGQDATATFTGSNGNYHWQARAVDANGSSSAWQTFGQNVASTMDFEIDNATTSFSPGELYSTPLDADADLVSYYRFEGNANDTRGTNNGITTSIAYSSTSGKFGQFASFNGSSSIVLPPLGISGTHAFSVSLWFESSSTTTNALLFNLGGNSGCYNSPLLTTNDNSGGSRSLALNWGCGNDVYTGANVWTSSVWHNVVFTYSGGNMSNSKIYLDGKLATTTVSGSWTPSWGNASSNVGNGFGGSGYYTGNIDDLAVFNRVLTASETYDLFNGTWPPLYVSSLNQYKSDAATNIPQGATTTDNAGIFGATLQSTNTSTPLQLQLEVTTSTTFSGTPNATSSGWVYSGQEATATLGLPPETSADGSYHWQAKVVASSTGATSTWQTFGPSVTSTDFVAKTVPLFTQIGSPYPSFASTSVVDGGWAGDTYDDGTAYCDGGNTIGYCGCAITSVSMWLRYYGIATDASGTSVDPRSLNAWLTDNGGYVVASGTTDGDLEWDMVPYYATPPGGGVIALDPNSGTGYGTTLSEISPEINSLLTSSTPDPVILVEPGHFVVATGIAENNGTSTYTIRDSAWYLTQYLNEATSTDTSSTIYGYGNNADGVFIYYDPPTHPLIDDFAINLPNSLMLIDSQGRRTGKDPVTGIAYHEIPDTSYFEGQNSGQLYFTAPPRGQYTLYILGGTTGQYYLNSWVADGGPNPPKRHVLSGNVQKGSAVAYIQNYDMDDIASSTPIFSNAVSSTMSIIATPPNNLPPPVVSIPIVKPIIIEPITPTISRIPTSTLYTAPSNASSFQDNPSPTSSIILSTSTIKY